MNLINLAVDILSIIVGLVIGYAARKYVLEREINQASSDAEKIVDVAKKEAAIAKKEAVLEAKKESNSYREKVEEELKNRRYEVQKQEERILQREAALDHKDEVFESRESALNLRERKLDQQSDQIQKRQQAATALVDQRRAELERVAQMSHADARKLILKQLTQELASERETMIRESDQKAQLTAEKKAKNLIVAAIQRSAADTVQETTATTVSLPSDDMKGRIIGREGRNVRTLESLTGIDLIIDDVPGMVVLSGFDPIRREIAKMALERLIKDGRIHPARIEEMVEQSRKDMDAQLWKVGEQAVFDLGLHAMPPDLIKTIGRLKYRTSYGQNVLQHSIEVAKLAGVMAAELGEDATLARRAGLLHDIGKAIDHEVEGSHVELGVELTRRCGENAVVINAIASHHDDVAPASLIASLVQAADAISGARPGARSESLERYIQRLRKLERLANGYRGVDHSYAIQAGREIRVIVQPNKVADKQAATLAYLLKKEIEEQLEYPGHIKVVVIRETRTVEYAK